MNTKELKQLENDLWRSADTLRANSDLKSTEYSTPVLGLIFLKFADNRYRRFEQAIQEEYKKLKGTRMEKPISDIAIKHCGFYLPEHARYDYLLNLAGSEDTAKAIKEAMQAIEEYKPELRDVLPKDEYFRLIRTDPSIPEQLLKNFSNIPRGAEGDIFGQIYEYFLGNFALAEGQGGGEFFTPRSVVQLMVEIIEPFGGRVFDPACGSGGMFVHSAKFIDRHRDELVNGDGGDIYVYGQEKTLDSVKLAKMNLAVNGLRGDIKQANTYYEDRFGSFGHFDYVLTNPPFNVDDVSLESVENDQRFNTYGIPRKKTKAKKSDKGKQTVPNANYLWINLFATSLNEKGRAALVMANSASDARHSEADIRRALIENNLIYGTLTLPSNMFYTVTLPATLWFFDKGKADERVLFIDARNIFVQIDRAHRKFSSEQIYNLSIISHLRKGKSYKFIQLVDCYFQQGMDKLFENKTKLGSVSGQLLEVLENGGGKQAVDDFMYSWASLDQLQAQYEGYLAEYAEEGSVSKKNAAQHDLRQAFDPFFKDLHDGLKQLAKIVRQHEKEQAEIAKKANKRVVVDKKTKALKTSLEELQSGVKDAESYFKHIHWLQERFPKAEYEDVTGLCKLATLDEIMEQDYSLNPGRYVGVVIEEDGKTEEEFVDELLAMNDELNRLNEEANGLSDIIYFNVQEIAK